MTPREKAEAWLRANLKFQNIFTRWEAGSAYIAGYRAALDEAVEGAEAQCKYGCKETEVQLRRRASQADGGEG